MSSFLDEQPYLDTAAKDRLRKLDMDEPGAVIAFSPESIARLAKISPGHAGKLVTAANAARATSTPALTVHMAEPPERAQRIAMALAAAHKDPTNSDALVSLGIMYAVLGADDRLEPAGTETLRVHLAGGGDLPKTWRGKRIIPVTELAAVPIWKSPRTLTALQGGVDELDEDLVWAELGLEGLRLAAFGFGWRPDSSSRVETENMFNGFSDVQVFEHIRDNDKGRKRILDRMKALGVKPEEMDDLVIVGRRKKAPPAKDAWRDGALEAPPVIASGNVLRDLPALLSSMFDGSGLRRFVAHGYEGERIASNLPGGNAGLAELAFAVANIYNSWGHVNVDLRNRLIAERPRKSEEIRRVFANFGVY